jgi:hypothetical protein
MRQRKIIDNELLSMLKEGKSQKACAVRFGVSEPAITKKLKRLSPPPEPESLKKLTPKEQKFVVAVAEGKSRTAAAMEAYDVSSRDSAKTLQNTLMQKDDIKIAISELMQIYGLTHGYRINKLKSHIDHVDPVVSLKGLDMSFKLDGSYANTGLEAGGITITFNTVFSDEVREMPQIIDIRPTTTPDGTQLTSLNEKNTEGGQ